MNIEKNKNSRNKKPYQKPTLTIIGPVALLTTGGSKNHCESQHPGEGQANGWDSRC